FIFMRHTSASLVIQENADPDVRTDLVSALDRLAPADAQWVHGVEGPDDMPAHVKTMLTGVSLHVPVIAGSLAIAVWQGIYITAPGRTGANSCCNSSAVGSSPGWSVFRRPPIEANRWQAVNTIPKSCYAIGAGDAWDQETEVKEEMKRADESVRLIIADDHPL